MSTSTRPVAALDLKLGKELAVQLMLLSEQAQRPGDNGWDSVLEALKVMDQLRGRFSAKRLEKSVWHSRQLDIPRMFDDMVKDDDRQIAIEALAMLRESEAVDLLYKAAACPKVVQTIHADEEMIPSIDLMKRTRLLAKALGTSMRQAAIEHDSKRIIRDAKAILILARATWHQPSALSTLVGFGCGSTALSEIRCCIQETPVGEAQCRELISIIDGLDIAPSTLVIEGERLRVHRLIDLIFDLEATNGPADVQKHLELFASGEQALALLRSNEAKDENPEKRISFATRAEMHALTDELYNELVRIAKLPMPEQRNPLAEFIKTNEVADDSQPVARTTVAAAARSVQSWPRWFAEQRDGTRLVVAIHAYKARNGQYPQTLQRLVPEFLPSLPLDSMNNKSFGYRISDDRRDVGILYLRGNDGEDDGGHFDPEDELAAFRDWKTGFDYWINRPRDP